MRSRQYVAGRGLQRLGSRRVHELDEAQLVVGNGECAVYQVGRYAVYACNGEIIESDLDRERVLFSYRFRTGECDGRIAA